MCTFLDEFLSCCPHKTARNSVWGRDGGFRLPLRRSIVGIISLCRNPKRPLPSFMDSYFKLKAVATTDATDSTVLTGGVA